MSAEAGVCPADADRLVALLAGWGCIAKPSNRWLSGRAERMRRLRAAGRIADGERYGWLTIAGLHARVSPLASLSLDPTSTTLDERVGAHDTLPCPLLHPATAALCPVPGTSLNVFDWRDPAAAILAMATCNAERSAVVDFGDDAYASAVFLNSLAKRMTAAVEDGDA